MSQAKLTHTLGDNINQSLLIWDNLGCILKKLSGHMAQETNGTDCLGRELKNTRHTACKRGGNKLRCEHGKMSVDFPNEAARCQRFLSGQAQSNFWPFGNLPAKEHRFWAGHRKVDELRNSEVSGKSRPVLLTPIGEARLTSKLCPCDLD